MVGIGPGTGGYYPSKTGTSGQQPNAKGVKYDPKKEGPFLYLERIKEKI
jgi:hypothetical protein